jgi:broad specificity phosphatase PhoE
MKNGQSESTTVRDASAEDVVIVGRPFEDTDDLTFNRDAPLKALDEESFKLLDTNVREIIRNTEAKGSHKILIVSSPKVRSIQTAEMIKEGIQILQPDMLMHIRPDERFAELYQGELILPPDYHVGDRVSTLPDAWVAFWKETFTEEGEYNNPDYRFGDPVPLDSSSIRYPEIVGHFSAFGECYREMCLRYYEALVDYFESNRRVKDAGINVVLIGHGATVGILSGLEGVMSHINDGDYDMPTGSLMKACRQEYIQQRARKETQSSRFGGLRSFSLNGVDADVVNLLKEEVEFLKVPENYEKKN